MATTQHLIRYVADDPERGHRRNAEYQVGSVADARRVHPRAMIAARIEVDDLGNATTRPFEGKQYWDDGSDETPPEESVETPSPDDPHVTTVDTPSAPTSDAPVEDGTATTETPVKAKGRKG